MFKTYVCTMNNEYAELDHRGPLESSIVRIIVVFIRLLFIISFISVEVASLRHKNIYIKQLFNGLKVKMTNSKISKFDLRSLQRDNDTLPSLADLQSGQLYYLPFYSPLCPPSPGFRLHATKFSRYTVGQTRAAQPENIPIRRECLL